MIYHFINGIYSGIPICCSFFFTKRYINNALVASEVAKERRLFAGGDGKVFRMIFSNKERADYVQCSRCFRENRIANLKDNGHIFKWILK
jgi:hypothetical protein